MWDLAVREEDYGAAEAMLARYAGAPLSYRLPSAYARGDTAGVTRMHAEARALDARQSQIAARFLVTYLGNYAAADSLARLDLQPRRNTGIRLGAQLFLAWMEVARRDWPAARRAFQQAEAMEGGQVARVERAFAIVLPFLEVGDAELRSTRAEIARWQPAPAAPAAPLVTALEPHLRLYLLALLDSRLGDHAGADARARELTALAAPSSAGGAVASLVATIRADVALRQNQPARALEALAGVTGQLPPDLVVVRPFVNVRPFAGEHARYLRAEALRALSRSDEAAQWMANGFQGSPLEMVYTPPPATR